MAGNTNRQVNDEDTTKKKTLSHAMFIKENMCNELSSFRCNEEMIASTELIYKWKDEDYLTFAWSQGEIAESDFIILYVIAVLGSCTKEMISNFLFWKKTNLLKNRDEMIIPQLENPDYMLATLRRLNKHGLIMCYSFCIKEHGKNKCTRLYSLPKIAFSLVNMRLGKRMRHIEGKAFRMHPEILGNAAASFIMLNMIKSEYFNGLIECPICKFKDTGTIQIASEVKFSKDSKQYLCAIDCLYIYHNKAIMSEQDYKEYIKNKINLVESYLRFRTKKYDVKFVLACKDIDDINIFANEFVKNYSRHDLLGNVYFTSEGCVRALSGDVRKSFMQISKAEASVNSDGEATYKPKFICAKEDNMFF